MPFLSGYLTRARLSRIQKYLGKRVLDVGCGYGELLEFLSPEVESVVLLDRSPERRDRLQTRIAKARISAESVLGDIEKSNTNLIAGSFDTVVMAALLEHLKSPAVVLMTIHRLLKENGRLLITTPTPLGGRLHGVGSHLGLTHPEAAQEHEQFYDFGSLEPMLLNGGFQIEHYERFLLGLNQLVVAGKKSSERPAGIGSSPLFQGGT